MMKIELLDTTLRDGAQGEGVDHSVNDKRKIALALDRLGIPLIEAGNPASNPKDRAFFEEAKKSPFLSQAILVPFGSTCRGGVKAQKDAGLNALLQTEQPVISIFGKADILQVTDVLRVTPQENLRMIEKSVAYLASEGRRVLFDAEHFFDGIIHDREYALEALRAALRGGADVLVLCDTKGGMLPETLRSATCEVLAAFSGTKVGIHCHDDMGLAVAGSIACIEAGATMAQTTIGGVGERCGNTNLNTLLPTLQLKMGYSLIPDENLTLLTETAREVLEVMNLQPNPRSPYVGYSAFAHKGGMHIDGMMKNSASFEHIKPELVGNRTRFLLSEQVGRAGVYARLKRLMPEIQRDDPRIKRVTERLKRRELRGYAYETADGSFDLMALDTLGKRKHFFEVKDYHVLSSTRHDDRNAQAYIKISVDGQEEINAAEGDGPVNALDLAIRKALRVFYPSVENMHLRDFKVRVIDSGGTASTVRVLIESTDGYNVWTTMGVSPDIIQACFVALRDSVEYFLSFIA
ncbi:MAG: citramalate synthase [Clostridiales bacterium]|nr:citramalate synthase [Clostridiales bacterium]